MSLRYYPIHTSSAAVSVAAACRNRYYSTKDRPPKTLPSTRLTRPSNLAATFDEYFATNFTKPRKPSIVKETIDQPKRVTTATKGRGKQENNVCGEYPRCQVGQVPWSANGFASDGKKLWKESLSKVSKISARSLKVEGCAESCQDTTDSTSSVTIPMNPSGPTLPIPAPIPRDTLVPIQHKGITITHHHNPILYHNPNVGPPPPSPRQPTDTIKTPVSPREIVNELDRVVVGQDFAKKVMAVAVFNHYNRVKANRASAAVTGIPGSTLSHQEKSNILVMGPTGCGKTLLAKTLSQCLNVPFSMNDATPFTQAGYVGEDVEMCIQRLLVASDYDVARAEMGIVFVDEIDKIARKWDRAGGGGNGNGRDVSGEGVQQGFLRMLEGTSVTITDKIGRRTNAGPPGSMPGNNPAAGAKGEVYQIDTSNILFILSGAFIGLDKIITNRVSKKVNFGFLPSTTANASDPQVGSSSASQGLQNGIPGMFGIPPSGLKESDPLVLQYADPEDLVAFGLIPEFVGRLPIITSVEPLNLASLRRILTEPKNSLVAQFKLLFASYPCELHFTDASLFAIAQLALKKNTGARGLRRIAERVLLEPMYNCPGTEVCVVVVTKAAVEGRESCQMLTESDRFRLDLLMANDGNSVIHVEPSTQSCSPSGSDFTEAQSASAP